MSWRAGRAATRPPNPAAASGTHLHLPTPGELYSSTVGSALTTVIDALAGEQARAGGRAAVLVVEGREHEARGAELVTFPPTRDWLTRNEKLIDLVGARVGLRRRHAHRVYLEALRAIPHDWPGPVILHNAPAAVSLLRRLRPQTPPVLYVHNDLFRSWGTAERGRLMRDSYRIVFVSEYLRSLFLNGRDDPAGVTGVVLNGASPQWFPARSATSAGPPMVLFVGRVTRQKGVDLLLQSCIALWRQGLDFRLRIVGRELLSAGAPLSPFEQDLRRLAAGHAERVEFAGFLDRHRIGEAYADADIACVPSVWDEPCSLTLPEALVAGLPAVASGRGGLPEVGGDAVAYFDPDREGHLAEVLAPLVASADRRAEVQRRCADRGRQLTWTSRLQELNTLLEPAAVPGRLGAGVG